LTADHRHDMMMLACALTAIGLDPSTVTWGELAEALADPKTLAALHDALATLGQRPAQPVDEGPDPSGDSSSTPAEDRTATPLTPPIMDTATAAGDAPSSPRDRVFAMFGELAGPALLADPPAPADSQTLLLNAHVDPLHIVDWLWPETPAPRPDAGTEPMD